ncbi:hypothetical protein [Halostella litorea]|uniref:hypothetical protein n=1 Tax=Halostella litorea TaxID=2528831 RepID=UPI0010922732|nr:hypothetical protein [Halostella litorea]
MIEDETERIDDLGEATIVYEGPDGDAVERTVDNDHIAYFQDHWIVKVDEEAEAADDDAGPSRSDSDTVRRIPAQRVYYVERSVEEFEEEVKTLKDQVQSFTEDLRSKFLGDDGGGGSDREPQRIEVEREGSESESR